MKMGGRTAIVTGGASGMGEAVVEQLLREDVNVVALDRDNERLAALAAHWATDRLLTLSGDIALEQTSTEGVRACLARFGQIDYLVNCAGIAPNPCLLEDTSVAEFDLVQAVNLRGTFLTMRAVLPHMKVRKEGSIVNISSTAGIRPLPQVNSYTATKWGVVGLSMSAALEAGPDGVRVNTICPGVIRTPMFEQSAAAEYGERTGQMTPMRRIGSSAEIAEAVVWLLSDRASFVTGAVLAVDGGLALI